MADCTFGVHINFNICTSERNDGDDNDGDGDGDVKGEKKWNEAQSWKCHRQRISTVFYLMACAMYANSIHTRQKRWRRSAHTQTRMVNMRTLRAQWVANYKWMRYNQPPSIFFFLVISLQLRIRAIQFGFSLGRIARRLIWWWQLSYAKNILSFEHMIHLLILTSNGRMGLISVPLRLHSFSSLKKLKISRETVMCQHLSSSARAPFMNFRWTKNGQTKSTHFIIVDDLQEF